MSRDRSSIAATFALVFEGVGALLIAVSMALYPGGTWMDRHAAGHSFWGNFLCDLQQPLALNGVPNPLGARLAQAGAMALFASCAFVWTLAPRALEAPRTGRRVRLFGLASSALGLAVPLLPSQRSATLHSGAIALALLPGLAALVQFAIGMVRSRAASRSLRVLTWALLVASVLAAVLWSVTTLMATRVPALLPAMQRLAFLVLLAWIFAIARFARRPERANGASP